jgi:SAM-dependent methyltransferase
MKPTFEPWQSWLIRLVRPLLPEMLRKRLAAQHWKYRVSQVAARAKLTERLPTADFAKIRARLKEAGLPPVPYVVDRANFEAFRSAARYGLRPYYEYGLQANAMEKYLEHYVSMQLLALGKDQSHVYIDLTADDSPMTEIVAELYGVRAFRQNVTYPPGVRGNSIGGDIWKLPLPDGFATRLTLHCSFEYLEGDRDVRFLREATRILQPGGRLCILPLYLADTYQILTNPLLDLRGLVFEADAAVYCGQDLGVRHARYYDVLHLMTRVAANRASLGMTLYEITNAREIHKDCHLRYALLFQKSLQRAATRGR